MADSLNISQSAYAQLESGRIGEFLDVDVAKLLSTENLKLDSHNNTFHDNSSRFLN